MSGGTGTSSCASYFMKTVVLAFLRTSVYRADAMVFSGVLPMHFSSLRSMASLVISPAHAGRPNRRTTYGHLPYAMQRHST